MQIKRIEVGYLQTNCYILIDNNDIIVIDPGDEYEKIEKEIKNKNLLAVIVTHHHFDHVGALKYFDNKLILDKNNLQEKNYKIGPFEFEIIYTPGHTNDSITIYFEKDQIMFTGDFLFKESIGRTDLGGNQLDMLKSIEKIKQYKDNIKIYPGHGDSSNLGFEKKNNMFF